ncbi:MAG: anti-sigma factor antagonist [Bacteroidia bacterium]|nr:anti-sigma factor antagonist [Bacteroidia bacterium]
MNVNVTQASDHSLISVYGRVDTTNADEFEKSVMEVVNTGVSKIILDCAGLNYISSSGLRVFLIVHKRMMANNGQLRLCSLQPGIAEIFDISGFTSIFSIYPDQESAEKA